MQGVKNYFENPGYCGYYGYSEKIKIINRLVDSDFNILVW
jgi:hypothetical protein